MRGDRKHYNMKQQKKRKQQEKQPVGRRQVLR